MSYFDDWNKEIEKVSAQGETNQFVKDYYQLEQAAYNKILQDYPNHNLKGSFATLQEELGFGGQAAIFAGFLEGINTSLTNPINLEELTDATQLDLQVDFAKLLYNMYDAKANWLYELEAWVNVFNKQERDEIAKKFRTDHIAVSNKVGRNDACPCGSGKKYKNCCAKK